MNSETSPLPLAGEPISETFENKQLKRIIVQKAEKIAEE
jgi:hypothetical protein